MKSHETGSLREKAENRLKQKQAQKTTQLSEADTAKLLYELEVNQLELEMQNEELVTARARTEQENEKLSALFDYAPIGYFSLAPDGRILEINFIGAQLLGKERIYFKNKKFDVYVSGETRPIYRQFLENVFANSTRQTGEIVLQSETKELVHVQITGIAIEQGEKCLLTAINITGIKSVEQQVGMLSQAMEQNPASVMITDLQGNIEYVNPRFLMLSGYSREEVLGKNSSISGSGFLPDKNEIETWEKISLGKDWKGEFHSLRKNGEPYWESVSISSIRDDKGKITHYLAIKEDITEHKLAEEALIEDQKQFRILNDLMSDYIYKLTCRDDGNFETTIIAGNYTQATGRSINEIGNSGDWHRIIHPDDLPALQRKFAEVLEKKHAIEFQCRSFEANGELRWLEVLASPETDPVSGKVTIIYGSVKNITEKKKSEQAIIEQEKNFRQLIENLHAGVVVHAPDTSIVLCNNEASELLGLSYEALIGKVAIDPEWHFMDETGKRLKPEDYPVFRVFTSKRPLIRETFGIHRPSKNDRVWVQVNAYPEFDRDDQIKQVVVTFINITEHKQAEEKLRNSEERWRSIVKTSPDGIVITSLEGTIQYVSDNLVTWHGYKSTDDMIGKSAFDFTTPAYAEKAKQELFKMLQGGRTAITEFELIRKNGSRFFVEINAEFLRNKDGKPEAVFLIERDITSRKKAGEVLNNIISRYKQLAEQSRSITWEVDANGLYTYMNEVSIQVLGYQPDEIVGKMHFYELHPIEGRKEFAQQVFEIFSLKEPFNDLENKILDKYGNEVWVTTFGIPVLNLDGTLRGYRGTDIDITKRRMAETAMRKSESLLRETQRISKIGGWEYDLITGESIFTDEIFEIYGYKFSQSGKAAKSYHPDDVKFVWQSFEKAIKQQVPYDIEVRFINAKGENLWVRTMGKPIIENGKTVKIIGNLMDITERKQAEEALRTTSQKWEAIIEASPDGIGMISLDGKLQLISDKLALMYGYSIEGKNECIGKSVYDFIDPVDHQMMIESTQKMFSGIIDQRISEYTALKKDHSRFSAELNSTILRDSKGNPVSILYIQRDITSRKQAEDQLRKLSTAIEQSPVSIAITDTRGNIEYVNPRFSAITGYTREELIGQNHRILKTGGFPDAKYSELWETITSGNEWRGEFHNKKKNGDLFWDLASISPIKNEKGKITHFLAVKEDITERKLIEDTQAFLLKCGLPGTGDDFFESLAQYLSETLKMEYVCIDRLEGDGLTAQTVAVFNEGRFEPNVQYSLKDTPCGEVVDKNVCCYRRGVKQLFPNDPALQELNAESYIGTTLFDSKGQAIGLIAIIGHQPLFDEVKAEKLLKLVALRASGELERREAEMALKETLEKLNSANLHLEERVEQRTQEILRLSNLHKAILNNAGLAVISASTQGIIELFNTAAEDMLGYKAGEVVGQACPDVFHDPEELLLRASELSVSEGEEIKADFTLFSSLLKQSNTYTGEWTYIRKDGSKFPVKLTVSAIEDVRGSALGYIGIAMDITQEKLAMDALRESEERFHKMFHNHAAVMLLVNPVTGKIVDANNAAKTFYGYSFDENAEISISDINALSKEQLHTEMQDSLAERQNYFEFPHKLASGEKRTVEVHSTPIEVSGQHLLFSIIHDITERKKTEEALKNSEKTLTQITDSVPVFIALADRDLTYTFVNSAYEKFFSRQKSDIVGKKISEIISEEAFERAKPFLMDALEGKTHTFENTLKNHEGNERIVLTTYTPYYQNNIISGILATVIDVTERVQADNLLRKSEAENRAILQAVPDILFRLNKDNIFLGSHTGSPEGLYLPPEVFIGRKITDVLPPNVAELAINASKEAFETHKTISFEYELTINGSLRFFEDRVLAISENEALSIVRDITQRKIAEKAVRWNESLLKMMASSSPLAFLVVDNRTDDILYFNHRFCEIWEITHLEDRMQKGELKNNDIIPDCLPALKDIPTFTESCKPLQDEENRVVVEDEIPFSNGHTIRRFSAQIRDARDEYHGRLYIFEDITQRKTYEKLIVTQRDLATSLSATTDLKEALNLVLKTVLQLENVDAGGVYIMDSVSGEPQLVAHQGLSAQFVKAVNRYKPDSQQAELVRLGKPVYGAYHQVVSGILLDEFNDNFSGLAVIPIMNEGKVIGSFNLASKSDKEFFSNLSITLEAIALQVGGVISRINAEKALFSSQQNFRTLFDTIDDFLFILDEQGKILRTNVVVEKRLGYAAEELTELNVLFVHPPERREEAGFIVGEMLAGRASFCPVPLYAKDGTRIPVETRVIMGKWDEKNALFGISRDITERQKTEAALRMQSAAFESFALAIIITNTQGKIQWANTAFSRLSGYSIEEITGKTNGELTRSGEQDAVFYKNLWTTIKSGKVWSGELINKRKNGSRYPEELTITPVLDYTGEISGFIAIKIDITSRKEMEQALRDSEARWNFALEGSGDGVWDWNVKTNEVFFSHQWKSMFGYSDAEIGNTFDEWDKRVHPDDKAACYADLEKHFSGQAEIYMNEHRGLCKNGSYLWILDRGKVIAREPDGKPIRVIGTHTDISKRKQLEETLLASIEKERELNELKSRFVSMASHEFRTPLASILMSGESLIAYWKRLTEEQIAAKLNNIKNQVQHLTSVVTDVMQVSKIQEGKLSFEPREENFVAICQRVIDNFNTDHQLKNKIQFSSDFTELFMFLDNRLMQQVLNNLISNGIKYAQPSPTITIRLYKEENEILLSLQDNGIGIPDPDKEHLFQAFFRAGNVKQIQGNGLGLNIVRESIRLHGGDITFVSSLGIGTTFFIHLPGELILTT